MTAGTTFKGIKRWILILALWCILQKSPLRAQENTFGPGSTAPGYASTGYGIEVTSSGEASTALGYNTTALGFGCVAIGGFTTASGLYSMAFGCWTHAFNGSIATGIATTASGEYSTTFGYLTYTSASAQYAIASGYGSMATARETTASGCYTTASGYYSTSSGYATTAAALDSFVVGAYNNSGGVTNPSPTSWVPTDPLFEVGNGSYDSNTNTVIPSDALVVYKNGNATLSGTLSIGGSNCVLVNQTGDISMGGFHAGPTPAP